MIAKLLLRCDPNGERPIGLGVFIDDGKYTADEKIAKTKREFLGDFSEDNHPSGRVFRIEEYQVI
jgi:hypothetical protein